MKLVLFKDLLEENAMPQYGILTDGDRPEVICLCCGGLLEFENYKILKALPWDNLSACLKQKICGTNKYVVCLDSVWMRNTELLETRNLSDDEFKNIFDSFDWDDDTCWHEMEPNAFIAVVDADSEESACRIAAEQYRYDSRCLYAVKVTDEKILNGGE